MNGLIILAITYGIIIAFWSGYWYAVWLAKRGTLI